MKKSNDASTQNIYCLDGRVPLLKAIPFGLQHVLAMFVANIAPIMIVAGVGNLTADQKAMLIQNVMFIAGLGTLVQLYPLWKVGAKLPIVMGISFTFVTILSYVTVTYGYAAAVGCTIVGGIIEGTLGPVSYTHLIKPAWLPAYGFLVPKNSGLSESGSLQTKRTNQ